MHCTDFVHNGGNLTLPFHFVLKASTFSVSEGSLKIKGLSCQCFNWMKINLSNPALLMIFEDCEIKTGKYDLSGKMHVGGNLAFKGFETHFGNIEISKNGCLFVDIDFSSNGNNLKVLGFVKARNAASSGENFEIYS